MKYFFQEGLLIYRFVKNIFPQVEKALDHWRQYALTIPDPVLKEQALASIKKKRFHCQGGNIYALYPGVNQKAMVDFIVAFQTISDYLDNLCDRVDCADEKSFRRLHQAMEEALKPQLPISDYYAYQFPTLVNMDPMPFSKKPYRYFYGKYYRQHPLSQSDLLIFATNGLDLYGYLL